jgi:hypothetical protein
LPLRFLADTNFDQRIVAGVLRLEPDISFELPQGVIPDRMKDPDVLAIAASMGRVLVSHDARTLPRHFSGFVADSESPGLILVPRSMTIAQAIEEIVLIWRLSAPDEWRNLWRRLPL